MRIAFYAPLKPPTHPVPSGDRRMAGLLMNALTLAGHEVELACRFGSRDGNGDEVRQEKVRRLAAALAVRLAGRYGNRPNPARPQLWFTYHLYYKAPDWLGPAVSRALNIPYVVAEASHAPKRSAGPWRLGHDGAAEAIAHADAVISFNPNDEACLAAIVADHRRMVRLRPFTDRIPECDVSTRRRARSALAAELALDPSRPWLLAVAMMRPGDKLESYRTLGRALAMLPDRPWQLVVVGDGPAGDDVESALAPLDAGGTARVFYAGRRDGPYLEACYQSCDLMVWPAVNEAYGMTLLEAQAAGLPVVAGRSGGVDQIVRDGSTGLLVAADDGVSFDAAFARAVERLLVDDDRRRRLGIQAARTAAAEHDLGAASVALDHILTRVMDGTP